MQQQIVELNLSVSSCGLGPHYDPGVVVFSHIQNMTHTHTLPPASKKHYKQESTYLICTGSKDHDPEHEKDAEPDLANDRRVRLDLVQQRRQKAPFSHCLESDEGKSNLSE